MFLEVEGETAELFRVLYSRYVQNLLDFGLTTKFMKADHQDFAGWYVMLVLLDCQNESAVVSESKMANLFIFWQ